MVALRPVDYSNLWEITRLQVESRQRKFVATNTQSLLEAYVTIAAEHMAALPFGIYDGDTLVGFIMFGYGTGEDEDAPKIDGKCYCLWRLMIGCEYQRRGYGRQAIDAALDYLRTFPCGEAESVWLSYEPENKVAKALYESFGFRETGEMCDGEVVAVRSLGKTDAVSSRA